MSCVCKWDETNNYWWPDPNKCHLYVKLQSIRIQIVASEFRQNHTFRRNIDMEWCSNDHIENNLLSNRKWIWTQPVPTIRDMSIWRKRRYCCNCSCLCMPVGLMSIVMSNRWSTLDKNISPNFCVNLQHMPLINTHCYTINVDKEKMFLFDIECICQPRSIEITQELGKHISYLITSRKCTYLQGGYEWSEI